MNQKKRNENIRREKFAGWKDIHVHKNLNIFEVDIHVYVNSHLWNSESLHDSWKILLLPCFV